MDLTKGLRVALLACGDQTDICLMFQRRYTSRLGSSQNLLFTALDRCQNKRLHRSAKKVTSREQREAAAIFSRWTVSQVTLIVWIPELTNP
jgi:hypothetical protein